MWFHVQSHLNHQTVTVLPEERWWTAKAFGPEAERVREPVGVQNGPSFLLDPPEKTWIRRDDTKHKTSHSFEAIISILLGNAASSYMILVGTLLSRTLLIEVGEQPLFSSQLFLGGSAMKAAGTTAAIPNVRTGVRWKTIWPNWSLTDPSRCVLQPHIRFSRLGAAWVSFRAILGQLLVHTKYGCLELQNHQRAHLSSA